MKSKSFVRIIIIGLALITGISTLWAQQRTTQKPGANTNKSKTVAVLPRLLDLGSVSCIPCKAMKPELAALEKEYTGRLVVQFVDVWKNPSVGKKYGIKAIPTQIFFNEKGEEVFRHTGFYSKDDMVKAFRDNGVRLEKAR
ncbi:MAG: thioredoxin family protein [Armatimonadetes bacterium]|jgi:thioredoxin 1|nr:thioredoxin family protein [Armatimonadota bacterium]